MSKNNVRIAIRDSTDSHNVAFFDNKAGIKYKSANLHRFLAGSASILTIKYNSKDIDSIRSGCKLAFRYKARDYWLNVMSFEKKGFEAELTAYSLGLELNNETRGEHKPANAMSIAEYVGYYDPEHALTIGVNEVSDKRIKLEWTGTDTILARLFSVANSFGAELDFSVELNDDYSLKRQVLNIYKKGNLGTNKVSQPVRVGKELKVINYSDNIKELRTAVRATGKDGLTIDGLDKKIYDNNKELLYYSSGMTVYAPQSRDRFPSVGKGSNDNWIVEDLGETQYETKEALWGYMYGEIQKKSLPEITYEVEGAIEAGIGDTQTLIDDIHFEPTLYVQARVSELEDDILTGKVTKSTFINFERKYSQIADILLKQVEALAEDAAPYIVRLTTDNGYNFKNGQGTSTITARLEKYSKDIAATWKWVVDNKVVGTGDKLTVKAEQVTNTMAVTVIAYVNGNEVVRDYMTFSNSDDGVGVESIDRYFTSSDQSDGVTIEGAEWSDKPPAPTEDGKYLWAYDEITYTDGTVTTTKPAAVGANFDVEAFKEQIAEELKDVPNREEFENKISEELANSKAEIETHIETAKTQAESNAKEYADTINEETIKVAEQANAAADEIKADLVKVKNNLTATSLVANNAQAAVDEAKQDLAEVASDLNTAKQDLADSVAAVNTKVDSTKEELTQAKQDLVSHAQQLQTQANAQTELTKRVTTVETTANGTKTTVNELTKTVAQNGKDITSVTNRTKTVEDDLANTKTTLTQVQTTANSASQKTVTLETGLNGLSAKFDNLKIGGTNLLLYSADPWQAPQTGYYQYFGTAKTGETYNGAVVYKTSGAWSRLGINLGTHLVERGLLKVGDVLTYSVLAKTDQETPIQSRLFVRYNNQSGTEDITGKPEIINLTNEWQKVSVTFTVTEKMLSENNRVNYLGWEQTTSSESGKYVYYTCNKIERGNVPTDYNPNDADIEQKVAEYKQNADQNYASLSSTVQTLDGQVQSNKTTAEQTAQGFKTRIESLETYKNGESERSNAYFESAKTETAKQLTAERTAIANNYVAKSTYTSDVTGIRNELSATTSTANATKTNLANYQASNDRAVANLQSNLQTANGNISSLKTKVEAVPGQITSAVSAVEGKIPTSVGGTNLLLYSADPSKAPTGYYDFTSSQKTSETYNGSVVYKTRGIWSGIRVNLGNLVDRGLLKVGDVLTYSVAMRAEQKTPIQARLFIRYTNQSGADSPTNKIETVTLTADWQYVSITFTVTAKMLAANTKVTYLGWELTSNAESGKYVYYACNKLERGSVATDWSSAPEDAIKEISSLSSQIKQTADDMMLLATKTELNTAKSDLQSGISTATSKANNAQATANNNAQTISTHTTQISALTTGLSAKVSQTDFNTLSGRVTTAENNITAKANELSSKITTVEGKIPTSVGGTNLLLYSADPWKAPNDYYQNVGAIKTDETLNGSIVYKTRSAWASLRSNWGKHLIDRKNVKVGDEFTYSIYAKTDQSSIRVRLFIRFSGQINAEALTSDITITNEWQKLSATFKVTQKMVASQSKVSWVGFEQTSNSEDGKFVYYACNKLERGNIPTDYQPAPEDYDSALATAQSEIKQTTDAITASVSALDKSTVKSASLTINTDGIVMKAGKSTTDVANAIGSYFAVNQNAINLFTDKINVKGSMIVSGAITSDKIASKQINTAHLNGKIITADVISSNAVTADAIKAGAVTTDKMSANSINGDRITAGTLDAAKIKAGSITASQIASGTITSAQIKTGTISAANIAAGAITSDKIASNSIDASKIAANAITADKIAANAITANMITGGQLRSTNGATVFDLNAGTLTFNNDSGYIQRVANDKIFEITTWLHSADADSPEYLTSAFQIRKSDHSRLAGVQFQLHNTIDNKPTASATINADSLTLSDSQGRTVFSIFTKGNFGNINMQGWGDIPVAQLYNCGLIVKDIGIGGHFKSLLNIVEELCKKTGIPWV